MSAAEKRSFLLKSWIGPVLEVYEKENGKTLDETELDFFIQGITTADQTGSRPRLWLEKMIEAVHRLENTEQITTLDVDSYFICLHGTIEELPKFFQKYIDTWRKHGFEDQVRASEVGKHIINVVDTCGAFNNNFDEDELLYIEIQRHLSSHVNPTGFEITIETSKNGEVSLNRKYKNKRDAHEVDRVLSEMESTHGSRLETAKYLKEKSKHHFHRLYSAVAEFTYLK